MYAVTSSKYKLLQPHTHGHICIQNKFAYMQIDCAFCESKVFWLSIHTIKNVQKRPRSIYAITDENCKSKA